jgi:hypothetical protein
MRKLGFLCLMLIGFMMMASCNNEETYADQKKREQAAINKYIADSAVTVISEDEFLKDTTTDVSKNEWVLFETSGVYMQIVRRGSGKPLAYGESATILCRFTERNLLGDSIQLSNVLMPSVSQMPDKMSVTNYSGTFQGAFDTSSLMYKVYGSSSTSVPQGWLVPLTFINLGRRWTADDDIAKVRIIVPHDMGQTYAVANVYPCLYDITYERGR